MFPSNRTFVSSYLSFKYTTNKGSVKKKQEFHQDIIAISTSVLNTGAVTAPGDKLDIFCFSKIMIFHTLTITVIERKLPELLSSPVYILFLYFDLPLKSTHYPAADVSQEMVRSMARQS